MADRVPRGLEWPHVRRAIGYLRWQWVAGAVFLSLAIAGCTQAFPFLQSRVIDRFLAPRAGSEWAAQDVDSRMAGVVTIAWIYLAISVVAFAAQYGFSALTVWMGQRAVHQLRSDLFAKLQRLPIAYFDRHPAGQVVTRVMSDVGGINRFVSTGLVSVAQSLAVLIAVAAFMLLLNWRLAVVAMLTVPLIFLAINYFAAQLRVHHGKIRQRAGIRDAFVHEHLVGMSTVQLCNQEAAARAAVGQLNRDWLGSYQTAHRWESALVPVVDFVTSCALAGVLWYGGGQSLREAISVGALVAFTQYLRSFFQPLKELSQVPQSLSEALASAERIFEVLDEPETVADPPRPAPIGKLTGEVELKDVWFSYQPTDEGTAAPWVLRGVNLQVKAGESIALVGATGAGKTTILSLLTRFYDVQRGEVRVDGVDVRAYAQRPLRQRIGLVLQDALLFRGTIESNLRMGNHQVPFERLVEVCKLVGIHDFIESLPDGYQTVVSERGATLSTGQKQLLSFARALKVDPEILLLDEATASIDTGAEQKIQAALQLLMRGRTSIIVAHRLSTVRHCDRILVMQAGQIVEQGPHRVLLELGGHYAKLNALQAAARQG